MNRLLVQINAKVPGTNGKRNSSDTRPDNVLKSSSSSDESLSGNAPAILVRGSPDVILESITNPPNTPITWTVKPNENSEAAPTITPDGPRNARLKADRPGSFSVIGTLGTSKVVWNVVFVWVKVDTAGSTTTGRQDFRNASMNGATGVSTGEFRQGKYAFETTVKAQVIGGGKRQTIGVGKVKVQLIQNCFSDTVTGNYEDGGTALETPKGGMPGLDANSTKTPFINDPRQISFTPFTFDISDSSKDRAITFGDSPMTGFFIIHQNSHKPLQSISGVTEFRVAVAGVSDDARNTIVLHAQTKWLVDFSGTVDRSGIYRATTAKVTPDASFTLISDSTGGQEALAAGFETMGPLFAGKPEFQWSP